MNRDQLIDWLARLIADGAITEDQAREIIREFDGGRLPDAFTLPDPPAPPEPTDDQTVAIILAGLLAVLGRNTLSGVRIGVVDRIQTHYEAQAGRLARRLADGRINMARWQRQMTRELRILYTAELAAASHGRLAGRELARLVDAELRRESAYLSRFADQNALRVAQTGSISAGAVESRAILYGGNARGAFFRQWETFAIQRGEIGDGWIVVYQSRDDSATCLNCLDADRRGPYIPGTPHPLPGIVCLGRSRCRCRLIYQYNPVVYRILTGGA